MRTKMTEVGRVDLGDDDAVVVTVVRRSWSGADNEHSGRKAPTTTAPLAVEVRRHPHPGDIVGGIVPDRARALAALISRAADAAEQGAADAPLPSARARRRGR